MIMYPYINSQIYLKLPRYSRLWYTLAKLPVHLCTFVLAVGLADLYLMRVALSTAKNTPWDIDRLSI